MEPLPIPSNMEGQAPRNPYSRLNTMFNPRLIASNLAMGALPGPTGLIDRMTGNNIRNQVDRATGAALARNQAETNAYMREMMRNDPGNRRTSASQRLREFFSQGRGEGSGGMAPLPTPGPRMYSPPQASLGSPQWGTGGPAPRLQFQNFVPQQTQQANTLYGSGQGMMRGPSQAPVPRGPSMLPSGNSGSLGNSPMMGVISGDGVYSFMDNAARSAIIWPEYIE